MTSTRKALFAVFGSALLFATICRAQNPPDTLRVNYFTGQQGGATFTSLGGLLLSQTENGNAYNSVTVTGATTPDELVDIVNPGTNGAGPGGAGDLCALIYVIDPDENMQECCGCLLSPNQSLELSVQNDLDANPLNGRILHNGALKIISSTPTTSGPISDNDNSVCDPGAPVPTPTLRAWITHVRQIGGALGLTETAFSDAALSGSLASGEGELGSLASTCSFIRRYASGAGRCNCPNAFTYANTFSYTGGPQTFTVPVSGIYQIAANGAQGGSLIISGVVSSSGGLGAMANGDFLLTAGQVYTIAVGGQGASISGLAARGAGGGGGSFVVGLGNSPLVIAGAGGGAAAAAGYAGSNGLSAPASQNGGASGSGNPGGTSGEGGDGGSVYLGLYAGGGGGGGLNTNGANGAAGIGNPGGGGASYINGLTGGNGGSGGSSGGFGGGGGGANGGGGGGGYSGGGGDGINGGGGGGSFVANSAVSGSAGISADVNSGNGSVVITFVHP